jgi:hypothetical protein
MNLLDRAFWPIVAAEIVLIASLQILSMRQEVQTFDEGFHLAAGYSYLSQGDYRMNPEHPPLTKLLAALAILPMRPSTPVGTRAWFERDQWEFAEQFLYQNRVDADRMLFRARLPTVALTAMLILAVAWWTRRRWGAAAGLIAGSLCAFDPNLIAHGRYVTSDLAVALFFFLTIAFWIDWLDDRGRRSLVLASIAFGLAQASKFSALILIPVMGLLFLADCWRQRSISGRRLLLAVTAPLLGALIVLGAVYGKESIRLASGKSRESTYVAGVRNVIDHNRMGHETYLLGEKKSQGDWRYFPVALLVKSPLGTLIAFGLAMGAIRKRSLTFTEAALGLAAAIYFGWCLTSGINLGIRHLLPFFPLAYAVCGSLLTRWPRWATAAVLLTALESTFAYPHYLAFFNFAAGGRDRGADYLVDSNLDWGQDLKHLKTYIHEMGNPPLCLEYFGTANLAYYGVVANGVPRSDPAEIAQVNCVLAISATVFKGLYVGPGWYQWLNQHQPMAKVGGSIYLFDLRQRRP